LKVQFQFFADCPSHASALERLKEVLAEERVDAELDVVEVESEEQAERLNFPGSPTILVDGRDIDSQGREGQPVGLTCRVYTLEDGRFSPLPSKDMIRRALHEAG
jgi:hypothetical protein